MIILCTYTPSNVCQLHTGCFVPDFQTDRVGTTVVDVGRGVGHSRGQESLCHTDGCRGQGEGRFCGINDLEVQDVPEEFTKHTCNSTMHQLGKIVELTLKITGNSHFFLLCEIIKQF